MPKPKAVTKQTRVMPDSEREQLVDQIEQEKAFQASLGRNLPETGQVAPMGQAGDLSVDPTKVGKRIKNLSRAISEQEAPQLRGAARNAALARHKQLEASLPDVLMSKRDQDLFPKDGHDYHVAVRKAKGEIGSPKVQADVAEYRRLGRSLFPEDPDKSSIERLRKLR